MKIKEIMTPTPECAVPETKLEELARKMVQKDCGAIPIVVSREDMRPVGIVTDRDITCRSLANGKNPLNLCAKDIMTTTLITLPENSSLEECCGAMEKNRIRRIIVVDQNGKTAGIVAQADVARFGTEHQAAMVLKDVSTSALAATEGSRP